MAMSAESMRQINALRHALEEIVATYRSDYSAARVIALRALAAVPEPRGPTPEETDAAVLELVRIVGSGVTLSAQDRPEE